MKGSDWLFSACKEVMARPDCWAGAKAEAEPARRAAVRVASFIIVKRVKSLASVCHPILTRNIPFVVLRTTVHDVEGT
jgi:hypothetical protein